MKFNINNYEGEYVMHCKTEEEAKNFCGYLHSVGRKWCNGEPYTSHTNWSVCTKSIIYYFNDGTYGSIGGARANGCTILEWSDFMTPTFTKADLRTGDVILRRNGEVEIVNGELKMFIRQNDWNDFGDIDDDLLSLCGGEGWDIISVRRPIKKKDCQFDAFNLKYGALVYEREEVEEMTLAEVCKLLGKNIKIVK